MRVPLDEAPPRVVVVMGVSGVGKTTVGLELANRLGWQYQEGDDLHSPASVAKMAQGRPLDDEDRSPWLERIARWIASRLDAGEGGIITCSALKRSYRDRLTRQGVAFLHLDGDAQAIDKQLRRRRGHFMDPALLASQLQTLEPLAPDEDGIVLRIGRPAGVLAAEAIRRLALV